MTTRIRRQTLFYLLLATASIVLLALALSHLKLQPGIPLSAMDSAASAAPKVEQAPGVVIKVSTFFKTFIAVVMVVLVVFGAYKLFKIISWKVFLRNFIIVSGLAAVALFILYSLLNVNITTAPEAIEALPLALNISGLPLAPVPPNLIWLVWVGLALVTALLGVWIIRWRARRLSVEALLSLEAERALQALNTGQDFSSVIIQCYWQMSLVLQKEKDIIRHEAMTAAEFERQLELKGFPRPPIQQLTRLFEVARYSTHQPTPEDEQKAFACLNAIIKFNPYSKPAH